MADQQQNPEPTEEEREAVFAPNTTPTRQGDGDPGPKEADPDNMPADTETGEADNELAGDRGKWNK
jgi:hypothetical protein